MKRLVILLISSITFIFSVSAQSPKLALDTTFHSFYKDDVNWVNALVKQSGKLIIGGSFSKIAGTSCKNICRLLNDSVVDPNFITGSGFNNEVKKIVVLPSDKMYVMGAFTSYSNVNINYLIKLNANGTPDLSFIPNFDVGSVLKDFVVQSDGMLVVIGEFNTYSGYSRKNLVRLKTNGSLDLAFNCGDLNNGIFNKIVLQSADRIILIGTFSAHLSVSTPSIVRLLGNGNVDNSFSSSLDTYGYTLTLKDIFIHQNDEISLLIDYIYQNNFSRYSANGTLLYDYPFTVTSKSLLLENGNFLSMEGIGSNNVAINNIVINEYSVDGTIEKQHTAKGWFYSYNLPVSLFLMDEEIYVGGNYYENHNQSGRRSLVRVLNTDEIDFHFLPVDGPNFSITDLVKHSTNKYVVIGGFTRIGSSKVKNIAIIDSNGVVDPSFNAGKGFNGPALAVAVQADGKIVVGGDFTEYNDQPAPKIIRLMPDGSVDENFNIGSGLDFPVFDIEIINSDQVLLAGVFGKCNGTDVSNLVCLNSDGSMNSSFNTNIGSGSNGRIRRIRKAGSKIYLIGDFNYFNGNFSKHIVRINYSGTYDNTFHPGQADNGSINDAVEFNGQLYVTGDFTSYNNLPIYSIAKLNLDGTSDLDFLEAQYYGSKLLPGINLEIVSDALVFAGAFARSGNVGSSAYRAISFDIEENRLANETSLFGGEIAALTLFPGDSADYYQKHLKLTSYEDELFVFGAISGAAGPQGRYVNFLTRYKIVGAVPPVTTAISNSSTSSTNLYWVVAEGELMFHDSNNSKGIMHVFDLNGRELFSDVYQTNTRLDISNYKPGLYIAKFESDQNTISTVKVVITGE